ncbi:MAG TPA: hypothetical protein VMH87_09405 [Pseudomonadales bacterium]|nr:hypothetical protein [Pseudomonadales bacterium]
MVPVKIECDCGQRYAFDVEPVDGRMPAAIVCPTCGADGTPAANDSITRHFATAAPATPMIRMISPAPVSIAPAASIVEPIALVPTAPIAPIAAPAPSIIQPTRLSMSATSAPRSAPPPTTSRPDPRLGLVGREQAEHEARAKAMWGDPPEQITSYLMVQGYGREEAMELTEVLVKERTSAVRANGIRKMIIGFGLMWVPVIALVVFLAIHYIPLKLMGAAILVGVYGAYLLIRGALMAIAPKSEKGDVADQ